MIRIAILYAAAMAAFIAVADAGWLPHFAERIHQLPYCDKVAHFMLYGLLALMANLALLSSGRKSTLWTIVTGGLIVAVVATGEEYSNRFVAARDWSWGDLAANYLGIVIIGFLPPFFLRLAGLRTASDPETAPPTAVQ